MLWENRPGTNPRRHLPSIIVGWHFSVFPPKLWSVRVLAALLGKGHLAMLNRDFDRERCLDDCLSQKSNFRSWEGVGAVLPVVIEDWAYHQQLLRDKKGSFIQKAIIIWQGGLQSVAFLMRVIVMQISHGTLPRLGTRISTLWFTRGPGA